MADGDGLPPDRRKKNNSKRSDKEDDRDSRVQLVDLDLGDDNLRKTDKNRLGHPNTGSGANAAEGARREDNPFSFKHFLRFDSNYQNKGARPKVFCDGRPVSSLLDTTQGQVITDNPLALPDFVQDHLVIEQCYLSNGPTSNYTGAQLPDFTQNGPNVRQNIEADAVDDNSCNGDHHGSGRPQAEFPLDLPLSSSNGRPGSSNEVAVSKSLPDFLNDGAVRSQTVENLSANQSPDRDPDRLQRELDNVRRQLVHQTNRADLLKRELDGIRNQEHEYTQNLIKALEQVEENLERSNRRAASAEATILKLRQDIIKLKNENSVLKAGNSWGSAEGAAGGPGPSTSYNHTRRLAQELRNAASTAEMSLRQLLSGVDNLRMMASTLDNMHRIEERDEPFLNSEDSGPAL